jgi:hypothetical protein
MVFATENAEIDGIMAVSLGRKEGWEYHRRSQLTGGRKGDTFEKIRINSKALTYSTVTHGMDFSRPFWPVAKRCQ